MNKDIEQAKTRLRELLDSDKLDVDEFAGVSDALIQNDPDALRFSVDAYHIQRLGYELVGKQETALSELIKNAYDADATYVRIEFVDYEKEGGTLKIEDDGHGMSEEVIRQTWMTLSTDDKEKNPLSPRYGRLRAGKKGIGRFAVQRIGASLTLKTFIEDKKQGLKISFKWDEDYKRGVSLTRVANKIEHIDNSTLNSGTELLIDQMREGWSPSQFDRVRRSIILLQPPFQVAKKRIYTNSKSEFQADPGFNVIINGINQGENSRLTKSFLDHSLAVIEGNISNKGKATYKVTSKQLDLKDSQASDTTYLLIGKLQFKAFYFIYESSLISGIALSTAKEIGGEYGGIRIYRDGFRVLPYGENEDDWLQLQRDVGRRTLLIPANSNNFFGHVDLTSEENILFEETSGREGLIENQAFKELQKFVRSCLEWGAMRVASSRDRKTTSSQKEFVSTVRQKPSESVKELLEIITDTAKGRGSSESSENDERIIKAIEHIQRKTEEYEEEKTRYEEMLRILASLGISIAVFSHEISGSVTLVKASLNSLEESYNKGMDSANVAELFNLSSSSLDTLEELGEYVVTLLSETQSRKKMPIPLSASINRFIDQFKAQLDRRGIKFEFSTEPEHLRTKAMHQSEVASVLFNFLTNSMKAMERANTTQRRISINAMEENGYAVIVFQDTGTGIDEKIQDKIFDAFYTTTASSDSTTGPSVGLGLKIVADIASANGGFVRVGKPEDGFASKIEFGVPKHKRR